MIWPAYLAGGLLYLLVGALTFGIRSEIYREPGKESLAIATLWPVLLVLFLPVWTYRTIRYLGRGYRDLYRRRFPKESLPKARLLE